MLKLLWLNVHGVQHFCDLKLQHRHGSNDYINPWIIECIIFRPMSLASSNKNNDSNKEESGTFGVCFKIKKAITHMREANVMPLC